MKTFLDIPFSLDEKQIMTQSHIKEGSRDAEVILSLIDLARQVGNPKAAYAVVYVMERDGENVQIENMRFTSRTLARNLKSAERVFPLVATCGHEMDEISPGEGDMLKEFWWDIIKTHLLNAANHYLTTHIKSKFRLGKTAIMRPGSGDAAVWPIEQQKELFALLDNVEELSLIHI